MQIQFVYTALTRLLSLPTAVPRSSGEPAGSVVHGGAGLVNAGTPGPPLGLVLQTASGHLPSGSTLLPLPAPVGGATTHSSWVAVFVGSTKCDVCNRRKHPLQRCTVRGCSIHLCHECWLGDYQRAFPDHDLDESVSWEDPKKPAEQQSQGAAEGSSAPGN